MEREKNIELAQSRLAGDWLGPKELNAIARELGIPSIPSAPAFPDHLLEALTARPGAYLAILGIPSLLDGSPMTLVALRDRFGIDPAQAEPCFYNQDWYLKEAFARAVALEPRWYLLRKGLADDSRGKAPEGAGRPGGRSPALPPAILCAFAFFAYFFHTAGSRLWNHDYVWCSDLDHQGDRIYVGRYTDPDGVQKNGFSVHRHLRIRECYGVAEALA